MKPIVGQQYKVSIGNHRYDPESFRTSVYLGPNTNTFSGYEYVFKDKYSEYVANESEIVYPVNKITRLFYNF